MTNTQSVLQGLSEEDNAVIEQERQDDIQENTDSMEEKLEALFNATL